MTVSSACFGCIHLSFPTFDQSGASSLPAPLQPTARSQARNEGDMPSLTDVDRYRAWEAVLQRWRAMGVSVLTVLFCWRLRRISRRFREYAAEALSYTPQVVVPGGVGASADQPLTTVGVACVEVLNLSTLRWRSDVIPGLVTPRYNSAASSTADGGLLMHGGLVPDRLWAGGGPAYSMQRWLPGFGGWELVPGGPLRCMAAAVSLPDSRTVVIGGHDSENQEEIPEHSVNVLAADHSGWSTLAPMGTARDGPAAAVMPCGKVLVAGGNDKGAKLKTAELWDPTTGAWSDLPPMAHERWAAGAARLPSGRIAVVGGRDSMRTAEAFDTRTSQWQPLPDMQSGRFMHAVVAVPGGLLAIGGTAVPELPASWAPDELFDEASQQWFELPHPMQVPRRSATAALLLPRRPPLRAGAAAAAAGGSAR